MTLMSYLRKLVYLIMAVEVSLASAGSFDDFFIAIRNDNISTLGDLLRRGFDPNTADERGQPGLTLAMQEQSLRAAKLLLEQPGLKIDALNQAGESALMMAALKGQTDWTRRLIERGAQVNKSGWTPLHYAATGPDTAAVKLLLDRGAAVNAESPNRTTPLMMAAQYGSDASVDLLLSHGADPKARNDRGLGAADFARQGQRDALAARLDALAR